MPPAKTKQLPETLSVTTVYLEGGQKVKESEELKTIQVRNFATEPAKLSVEVGATLNLGNYESARVTIGVQIPCYVEEMDFCYEYAQEWAAQKMQEECKKIHEYVKEKESF